MKTPACLLCQFELLYRSGYVALPCIGISLRLVLFETFALNRISMGLQVIQRDISRVAGELFGEQLDRRSPLIALQQQIDVFVNQASLLFFSARFTRPASVSIIGLFLASLRNTSSSCAARLVSLLRSNALTSP